MTALPLIPQTTPNRYTTSMLDAVGASRVAKLAARLARPVKIILTLAVCGWLARDAHRKLTFHPRPRAIDASDLVAVVPTKDRPDVTDELREALAFFRRESPTMANRTVDPDDALSGPWEPQNRPELPLIVRYFQRPDVAGALDRVVELTPGTLVLPSPDYEHARPFLSPARRWALHVCARARLRWEGNDNPLAGWRDIMAVFRLARMVCEQPSMVSHLVGMGLEAMARASATGLLMRCPPPARMCSQMRADFDEMGLLDVGQFARTMRGQIATTESEIAVRYTDDGRGNGWLDLADTHFVAFVGRVPRGRWWNLAAGLFNDRATMDDKLRRRYEGYARAESADVPLTFRRLDRLVEKENIWTPLDYPVAYSPWWGGGPGAEIRGIYEQTVVVRTGRHALRAAMALVGFHAERGRYPDRIEELVPDFLAEVPRDLFDGQPLRYRRQGAHYLLYSVHVNRRDDGGIDEFPNKGGRADEVYSRPVSAQWHAQTLVPGMFWNRQTKRYEPVAAAQTGPAPTSQSTGGGK